MVTTMAMTRTSILLGLAGCTAAATGAPTSSVLAGVHGGLWELEGLPTSRAPVKQCIADPLKLAALEHKSGKCTQTILNEAGSTVRVRVQCAGGDFGQASIKLVTPRALRVEVQGIADGAPYGYVVQARNVGPCPAGGGGKPERGRH